DNHVRLADVLASGGDLDGAIAACRSALAIQPDYPPALVQLALILRAKLPDEDRQRLEAALQQPISETVRAGLHFRLGQVADARADFSGPADDLRRANAVAGKCHEARHEAYDPGEFVRYVDRLIEICSPNFFARFQGCGLADERPVFVFGMPRSGTTLF